MNRILRFLCFLTILIGLNFPTYSAIQTDGMKRDPAGGGGIYVEKLSNETIDGNQNTLLILRHATDCTTFTTAIDGQYCWEQDADTLYVCETANVCDTAGEWDAVASGGGGSITVKESDNTPTVTNVTTISHNASHFTVTDSGAGVATIASILSPLATALAVNGADCSAGNAARGVDASGAAESCFDVIIPTEIDSLSEINTIAGTTLRNFGTETDENLCSYESTGTLVDCDTPISTFLTPAMIDTLAELDTIVADKTIVDTDSAQTLTGKTLDGNSNTLQQLRHATDCTAQTGKAGQFCLELDVDNLYFCEPSAGDCDTAGEWKLVNVGNAATATQATQLGANGTNCSDSIATIGTDASGNAEGCFDVIIPSEIDTLAKLNNLISSTLQKFNTLTDENLCSYESTGTQVDCDTPISSLASAASPTFTGTTNISERLDISGVLSPAQITANQTDYNPTGLSTAAVLRLSTDASRNIISLAGGASGRVLVIHNVGSQNIVLKDDDGATGTASMRFALTSDLTLLPDQVVVLFYDNTTSRWRSSGLPTSFAQIQGILTDFQLPSSMADKIITGSLAIPQGTNPTVDAAGEIAHDTTADSLVYGANAVVVPNVQTMSRIIESITSADDNMLIGSWAVPVTITGIACHYAGSAPTTVATFTLEDGSGNAMTITGTNPTCAAPGSNAAFAAVTAANTLVAGEALRFDTTNTPNPATDTYQIIIRFTYTRE